MTTAATLFAGPGALNCGHHNTSIAFHYALGGTIRTLSSTNPPSQDSYKGLLFVPTLNDNDKNNYNDTACTNLTAPFIPTNATLLSDLAPAAHDTIGLAPWLTPDCARAYLAASQRQNARALIFYQPTSADTAKPPPPDNELWDLGDGGAWRKEYRFPVYAVPGPAGSKLMHELSLYSGRPDFGGGAYRSNMSEEQDCTRLYALLDLEPEQPSTVPGIWVFVLSILGSIVLMLVCAFFAMQHVKKKRRANVQARLVAGEVDLEYLGIRRLVVPPQLLCQLPVYTYPEDEASKDSKDDSTGDGKEEAKEDGETDDSIAGILDEITPPPRAALNPSQGEKHRLTFSQHTCAICLDDFVPGSSLVRELPCTHIFHPECVDAFLMRDGSACPVCKASVLPASFVEYQVSHFMRREQELEQQTRHGQRHRNRPRYARGPMHETQLPDLPLPMPRILGRLRAWVRGSASGSGSEEQTERAVPEATLEQRRESYDPVRREMMQRRAMVLLGRPVDDPPRSGIS